MDRFQVPCCSECLLPLIRGEHDERSGVCPSIFCERTFTADTWAWIHQDVFNGSDLPPFCGYLGPVVA